MKASTEALVIAGGHGSRMAATHADVPKPLVRVHGIPLIALTMHQLRRHGVRRVHVALRHRATETEAYVRQHLASGFDSVSYLREAEPLGTVGALGLLSGVRGDVLVVNGDLVSGIDLENLGAVQRQRVADMTIATHWERRRLELGEVLVDRDENVTGYLEKPIKSYRISSGTYVVGERVRALIEAPRWLPFPELVQSALGAGLRVVTHDHGAGWVDVNSKADLARAEQLLMADPVAFGLRPQELHDKIVRLGIGE